MVLCSLPCEMGCIGAGGMRGGRHGRHQDGGGRVLEPRWALGTEFVHPHAIGRRWLLPIFSIPNDAH